MLEVARCDGQDVLSSLDEGDLCALECVWILLVNVVTAIWDAAIEIYNRAICHDLQRKQDSKALLSLHIISMYRWITMLRWDDDRVMKSTESVCSNNKSDGKLCFNRDRCTRAIHSHNPASADWHSAVVAHTWQRDDCSAARTHVALLFGYAGVWI